MRSAVLQRDGTIMKISRLELRKIQPDLEDGGRKEEPRRKRCVYRKRICAATLCTIAGFLVWSVIGMIAAAKIQVGSLQIGLSQSNVTDLKISFAATPTAPLPLGHKLHVRSASCTLDFVDAATSPKNRIGAATSPKKLVLVSADLDVPVALFDRSVVASSVTVRIEPARVHEARTALRAFVHGRGAQVMQCSISTHLQFVFGFPLSVNAMVLHRAGDPEDDTSSWGLSLKNGGLQVLARAKVHTAAGMGLHVGAWGISIPLWLNATGTRARFHEQRLHIQTGAERPLGPGIPVGDISISTDLETVIDSHIDIVPPTDLAQMVAAWLPPLKKLTVDPRLLEAALEFDAQASTIRPDGNRAIVAAGWRVRVSSGFSSPLELLSLPKRFPIHLQVRLPSLPKACRRCPPATTVVCYRPPLHPSPAARV